MKKILLLLIIVISISSCRNTQYDNTYNPIKPATFFGVRWITGEREYRQLFTVIEIDSYEYLVG